MTDDPIAHISEAAAHRAVAELHHRFLTAILLVLVSRKGAATAGEATMRLFRRQHHEKFLAGIEKLGVAHLPDAQKCAAYHYLSNGVGGVKVEYVAESPTKAWVRFVPPRWIYDGTAVPGIPTEVSRGILHGWYKQNGITLQNPRLGFVCVSQTMDAGLSTPGLVGYFKEYSHNLSDDERLQFKPEEDGDMPCFNPIQAPQLEESTWPPTRKAKAARNYAVEYIRNLLPVLSQMFGPHEAAYLSNLAGRMVGMSFHDVFCELIGVERGGDGVAGVEGVAKVLLAFSKGCDDSASLKLSTENGERVAYVSVKTWRMVRGQGQVSPSVFEGWVGLIEGLVSLHDRFVRLEVVKRLDLGDGEFGYRLSRVKARPRF